MAGVDGVESDDRGEEVNVLGEAAADEEEVFPCPRASARPGRGTRRASQRWPCTLAATSRARPCISRLCRARDGQHGTQGDGEGRRESHALEDRDAPAVVLGVCVEAEVLDVLRAVEGVPFDHGMFTSPTVI